MRQAYLNYSFAVLRRLSLDDRFALCRSVGEECIQEDELRNLLLKKPTPPICYDGFEPSGRVHIAQVSTWS
jgi:tyrosyl-tRNA synthetase